MNKNEMFLVLKAALVALLSGTVLDTVGFDAKVSGKGYAWNGGVKLVIGGGIIPDNPIMALKMWLGAAGVKMTLASGIKTEEVKGYLMKHIIGPMKPGGYTDSDGVVTTLDSDMSWVTASVAEPPEDDEWSGIGDAAKVVADVVRAIINNIKDTLGAFGIEGARTATFSFRQSDGTPKTVTVPKEGGKLTGGLLGLQIASRIAESNSIGAHRWAAKKTGWEDYVLKTIEGFKTGTKETVHAIRVLLVRAVLAHGGEVVGDDTSATVPLEDSVPYDSQEAVAIRKVLADHGVPMRQPEVESDYTTTDTVDVTEATFADLLS